MRFRPANISLINRRLYLPRLRLILSSIEKDDLRLLTGHYISMSVSPTTRERYWIGSVRILRVCSAGEVEDATTTIPTSLHTDLDSALPVYFHETSSAEEHRFGHAH